MAELFAESGQSADIALSAPSLVGIFLPAIDDPNAADGLGVVTPWGSGATARKYGEYGPSTAEVSSVTQLRDLSNSLVSVGGGISYNFEGLVGPQGPAGKDGLPGVTTIIGFPGPIGLANLPDTLNQINNWAASPDTLMYGGATHVEWTGPWAPMSVFATSTWNDAAMDEDGSLILIAADTGIHVSQNGGTTWVKNTPTSPTEGFDEVGCNNSLGNTSGLGQVTRGSSGVCKVWVSANSGVTWNKKDVATILIGKPLEGDLCSGTTDGDTLPDDPSFEEREISLGAGYSLVSGNRYTIVVSCTNPLYSLGWNWEVGNGYSSGAFFASSDSGNSWSEQGADAWFKTKSLTVEKDSYTFSGMDRNGINSTNWGAQTFTALSSYTVTSIVLKLNRLLGRLPGTVTVSIRPAADVNLYINSMSLGASGSFLLCTTTLGVYKSTNLANSWTRIVPDGIGNVSWDRGVCSGDGTYLFVKRVSDGAIYRSANSGTTWAAITPAGGDTFSLTDIAISSSGQYVVIVGVNSTNTSKSCYVSTNYGVTWTSVNPMVTTSPWTDCDISDDGKVVAVSRTDKFFVSFNGGELWVEQNPPATHTIWKGLSISADGKVGIMANTGDSNEYFKTAGWLSRPTVSETAITTFTRSLLAGATAAEAATTLGLGTTDSPTFAGLTLTTPLSVANGGSGVATLTDHGILLGSGTGAITPLGVATDGQIPIGSSGADPVLATLTAGTGIGIANAAGSITVSCTITPYTDEMVDDRVASLIQNGTGISWTYDDVANTLTGNVSITQYTDELAQDAVGGMVANSATINLTYTDLTPSLVADLNSTLKSNYDAAYTHSGLITGNPHSVTKSDVGLGSVENTALSTWAGTTNITTLGTIASGVWNGTDIAIADGGTGQSTAQDAINALTAVAGATAEHVLTKDTVSGNAIFKAAAAGYTDEQAQDAVGGMIADTNTINLTYTDATPELKADLVYQDTASVDLAEDASGLKATVLPAGVDHNSLNNYSANKHIDHTTITLTAGAGLTGGGDISANRTFALSHLGLEALVDPNANNLIGWDDTDGVMKFITLGANLSYDHATHTLSASGGGANHNLLDGSVHPDTIAQTVTRGSIVYGNSTPKWDELVLGAANTFLGSDGTDLSYRTAAQAMASLSGAAGADFSLNTHKLTSVTDPAAAQDAATKNYVDNSGKNQCRMYCSSDMASVASGSWFQITLDTDDFDPDSISDTGTYTITPNKAGYYLIVGSITWVGAYVVAGTVYTIGLFKNGAPGVGTGLFNNQVHAAITGSGLSSIAIAIAYFNGSTDYVRMYGIQYCGTRTDVDGSADGINTWLSVNRLG